MTPTSMKVIILGGVLTFVLLLLMASGLKNSMNATPSSRATVEAGRSPFDGKRAYDELGKVVGFGPRPVASPALEKLRDHIEAQLRSAGLSVRRHEFEASTPLGTKKMVNLIGVVEGSAPGVMVLGNHYDTKYLPDFEFVGANDGGSTTAWMIELARTLGPKRTGCTVWLCFFDGEEAFEEWSEADSLYGSRELVAHLRETGELGNLKVMVNVDMIGDCHLGIKRDPEAPEWLQNIVAETAGELGYDRYFSAFPEAVEDDHVPFRRAGVPAMDLIDFCYGSSRSEHVRNWHTARDTIDRTCWESLQVVGDVIYHALPKMDVFVAGMTKADTP